MKKLPLIALIAVASMALGVHAAERPDGPAIERPDRNGTTSDEVVQRPERPTDVNRPEIDKAAASAVILRSVNQLRETHTELDRIKEALKRLRENAANFSDEQIAARREALKERAKNLLQVRARVRDRLEGLKPRLGNRDELLDKAKEIRDRRQTAQQASTARERE